jgi:hypothetical protein
MFFLLCGIASAQAVRVDPPAVTTASSAILPNSPPYAPILAVPNAQIQVFGYPANANPPTNYATTYTDAMAGTACVNPAQVVLSGTNVCTAYSDAQGNFGFWLRPGNYTYTETVNGTVYGPFPLTAPGITQNLASVSIKNFGAAGDGVTDDTASIQAAINAQLNGGMVSFPAGVYKTTSALTLKAGVSLSGYGATIQPATTGMTVFSLSYSTATSCRFTVSGLAFDAQSVTGVTGISLTFCKDITLRDLRFVAMNSVTIDRAGNGITLDNVTSSGNLVAGKAGQLKIWSSVDTDYVNYVTVDGYHIFNTGTGVVSPAVYLRRAVGVHIDHVGANDMHVGGDATGILVENDCQGDRITNSILGSGTAAIAVQTGAGVNIAPSFLTVANVDSDQMTLAGYYVVNGSFLSFQGGKITASGATPTANGILMQDSAGAWIQISNMQFSGFTGGVGITFSGGSWLDIHDNTMINCNIGVGANGTNTNVRVYDNHFFGATLNVSGVVTGSGNWIYHNFPRNPAADVTPSVPASNAAVTNTSGFTVRYGITGGTVSNVILDGVLAGASATVGSLNPGETLAITYSAAPTWIWVTEP